MSKCFILMGIMIIAGSFGTSGNKGLFAQDWPIDEENYIENEHFAITLPENYALNKTQGKDGVIYYIESQLDGTVEKHGEIFLGFHPGTVELFYGNDKKVQTVSIEILDQRRDLGIYLEKNVYATIAIFPIKNNNGLETYIRIIGVENTIEKLYDLINRFSTLII